MKIKSSVLKRGITHEQHMQEVLKDVEYQKDYLRLSMQEYAKDGDYTLFFKSLERVIKARGSVSKLTLTVQIYVIF